MNITKNMRGYVCALSSIFSAAVFAADAPPLPDLPNAADYLAQRGVEPAFAKEFVKKTSGSDQVRMLSADHVGSLIFALRMGAADAVRAGDEEKRKALATFTAELMRSERDSGDMAYALPIRHKTIQDLLQTDCLVRAVGEPYDARKIVGQLLQSPAHVIENANFSDQEILLVVTGHEYSHCPKTNIDAPATMKEVDADIHLSGAVDGQFFQENSIAKLAQLRVMGDMCNRSGYVPTGHSTGLFIDAKLKNETLNWEQVMPVYGEALPLLKAFKDARPKEVFNGIPCFVAAGAAFKVILDNQKPQALHPLTKHYMEMTVRGVQAFAPLALDQAVQKLKAPSVAGAKPN